MAKRRISLNCYIPMVLVIAALMVPVIAEAGPVKLIWPDQLIPVDSGAPYIQDVSQARNNIFYAPISLPLGRKVLKITYYHIGGAFGFDDITSFSRNDGK